MELKLIKLHRPETSTPIYIDVTSIVAIEPGDKSSRIYTLSKEQFVVKEPLEQIQLILSAGVGQKWQ